MGSVYRRSPLDKLSEPFNLQKTYTQSLSDSVAKVPLVPTVADKIHIKFTGQTDLGAWTIIKSGTEPLGEGDCICCFHPDCFQLLIRNFVEQDIFLILV